MIERATAERSAARLGAGLAALLLGTAPSPEAPTDLTTLLSKAEKVQKQDIAAWARFRFRRHHLKEYLDTGGRATRTQDLEFMVTPAAKGFDERLVKIGGRAPNKGEVKEWRRAAKFSQHYATLLGGDKADDEEGAYSLGVLFRLASYRFAGRESIDGVKCYRVDFSPDPSRDGKGIAGRFAEAMKGSLWVTVDGLHLIRARARTIRPIAVALSLAKVYQLEVSMHSRPVAPGIYLPSQIMVRTNSRILSKSNRQRNVYTYSEFTSVDSPRKRR